MLQDILTLRLAAHSLIGGGFSSVENVVRHMGCMQAQDIHQATRAVGSRVPGSTKQDVKKALKEGKIVRTRPMRGTLHYMAPENVHRMLDLCASKTLPGFAKRREFLGISDKHAERALEMMDSALRGGKSLTRSQLKQTLEEGGLPMRAPHGVDSAQSSGAAGQTQRVYHLACYAATRKLICFGPPTDKEETFVLLDERVPKPLQLNYDEQLATLATMYLRGHGPATVDDLARWTGLGKTVCKQAIASIADTCETLAYNDKTYYYIQQVSSPISHSGLEPESIPAGLKLLAGFDEYFLGYKDRSIVADTAHYEKMFTKNGIFFPLIIVDGRVVGVWKRTRKKDTCIFDIQTLPGQKIDQKQLYKATEEYAHFWGVEKIIV